MRKHLLLFFTVLTFTAYGQVSKETVKKAMTDKFEAFKQNEKFVADESLLYPGIADPKMRPILTEKINQAAEDFKSVAVSDNPTDEKYQEKIKIGLSRFSDLYLKIDTEDRERVCMYFQELMDIVGLKSSNGQLNIFMYGFDPAQMKK
jgi:hypothetical protein